MLFASAVKHMQKMYEGKENLVTDTFAYLVSSLSLKILWYHFIFVYITFSFR